MVAFKLKTWLENGMEYDLEGYMERGINVLFGASGAGKTLLIRHLIGLSPGIHLQDGDPIKTPMYRTRNVAYLPQGGGIFPKLSIEKNIFLGSKPSKEQRSKADSLMKTFGLKFYPEDPCDSLSGGEKLRLGLIRTLIENSEFMFLDEPFSGLDPYHGFICREAIEELPDQDKRYILFSTHELEDAKMKGANLLMIDEGKVRKMESSSQIRDHFFNPGAK